MDIRTAKIDRKKQKVDILFDRPNGTSVESVTFPCRDAPAQSFRAALQALDGHFRYIMELKPDSDAHVIGVHFGEKGGRDNFQLLGLLVVGAGASSLNTPVLWEPDVEKESAAALTAGQVDAIRKVAIEAEKYVNGNREQHSLDLADQGAAPAEEAGAPAA